MCFEGLARLSRRVWRRFVRGSREISLVPSLHRASTDALIYKIIQGLEIICTSNLWSLTNAFPWVLGQRTCLRMLVCRAGRIIKGHFAIIMSPHSSSQILKTTECVCTSLLSFHTHTCMQSESACSQCVYITIHKSSG